MKNKGKTFIIIRNILVQEDIIQKIEVEANNAAMAINMIRITPEDTLTKVFTVSESNLSPRKLLNSQIIVEGTIEKGIDG